MVDLSQKHSVISIILPFKNEEAYLTECIESILNQSYPYWELVLVASGARLEALGIPGMPKISHNRYLGRLWAPPGLPKSSKIVTWNGSWNSMGSLTLVPEHKKTSKIKMLLMR